MAWRSHGATNSELVQNLAKNGLINSQRVQDAMCKVDRANYVTEDRKPEAYRDGPQPIGYGATISAPHMHANALENLLPFLGPRSRVLDVGSGSGFMMACFHHLITDLEKDESTQSGFVLGIEHIPELSEASIKNLRKDGLGKILDQGKIKVSLEDGRNPSIEHGGNWDVIHVGAAAPKLPSALLSQLASPGRMFIPVGEHQQSIYQVDKDKHGRITQEKLYAVSYVPLTDR
ncbi:protein-L-isoaspartate O-methyltransferase [Phakopsora pachyrhizi]|nr:protein-L-isoaspartate O-methyltransferase [Phakopsora pachyrhizi]